MARQISLVCYDFPTISRFFRSVALAVAMQRTTRIEWETYRDSAVINAIYSVLFWKEPPGWAEVKSATTEEVNRVTDELHLRYLEVWLKKVHEQGPAEGNRYVSAMEDIRNMARADLRSLYSEVSSINAEVIGETQTAIKHLAQIKLGAQVGVAVIGGVAGVAFVAAAAGGAAGGAGLSILGMQAGAGAGAFGLTGAAHSITHAVIKDWSEATGAQVAGIKWDETTTEVAKSTANEVGGRIAERSLEKALTGSARSQATIRSIEGQIRKYSERLAQEGLRRRVQRKAAERVTQETARKAAAQTAKKGFETAAKNAARVGYAIPVVFAAWDIFDAVKDYRQTTAGMQ